MDYDEEIQNLRNEILDLKKRLALLEKEKKHDDVSVLQRKSNTCAVTKVNVGGTIFTTLTSTLSSYPSSMLAAMFSGRHNVVRDENDVVFIDRDPKYFHLILSFLRGEEMIFGDEEAKRKFNSDCEYYGLPITQSSFSLNLGCLRILNAASNLYSVAAHKDIVIAGCNEGNMVRVWNRATGVVLGSLLGHEGPVLCAKIVMDAIVTGSADCTVRVWDLKTLECKRVLTGHTQSVSGLDICDGIICSASADWVRKRNDLSSCFLVS